MRSKTTFFTLFFISALLVVGGSLNASPVADNNAQTTTSAGAASLTISGFSVPANSDRLIVVCALGATISGATFDGVAMTPGPSLQQSAAGLRVSLFYRVLGSSGSATTGNVVVSGSTLAIMNAASYHNVHQSTPIDGGNSGKSGESGTPTISNSSLTITSEAGDLVCDCLGHYDAFVAGTWTVEVTQTEISNDNTGGQNTFLGMSNEGGAASVPMDWTLGTPQTRPANNHATIHLGVNINASSTVPVELVSFEGMVEDNSMQLLWSTASESNNEKFEIEESRDGQEFQKIGEVSGSGNTTQAQHYGYKIDRPKQGLSYFRLKQVDFDGQFEYSKIITLHFKGENNVGEFYPNPSQSGAMRLSYTAPNDGEITVSVFNLAGQQVIAQTQQVSGGINDLNFDFSGLNAGSYIVRIGDGATLTHRELIIAKE